MVRRRRGFGFNALHREELRHLRDWLRLCALEPLRVQEPRVRLQLRVELLQQVGVDREQTPLLSSPPARP